METPCQRQSDCLQQIAIAMRQVQIKLESQSNGSLSNVSNVLTIVESITVISFFFFVMYCFHFIRLPRSVNWRSLLVDLLESSRNRQCTQQQRGSVGSIPLASSSDTIFERSTRPQIDCRVDMSRFNAADKYGTASVTDVTSQQDHVADMPYIPTQFDVEVAPIDQQTLVKTNYNQIVIDESHPANVAYECKSMAKLPHCEVELVQKSEPVPYVFGLPMGPTLTY